MTPADLITFEAKVATLYEEGVIRAPVHLRTGGEEQLIEIFKSIRSEDYVFSTWASHRHALLKGIRESAVLEEICKGNSISLSFPSYRFYSSAIVGGICPIATGTAYAITHQGQYDPNERVFCFVGDMAAHTGIFYESIKYSIGHDLPITFIVENNGVSVGTPTDETWGVPIYDIINFFKYLCENTKNVDIKDYNFSSSYPHAGTGTFVEF